MKRNGTLTREGKDMIQVTKKNGKRVTFPWILTDDELENLRYNSDPGTYYDGINVVTMESVRVKKA